MEAYRFRLPVRFSDVDPAGIVFYPRFFEYFHQAFESFFGHGTGVPYHVWIQDRRIGWPAVKIQTDFRAPARYGMELEIRLGFHGLGTSSFVSRYEARDLAAGTLLCASDITVVTVNLEDLRPCPIPAEVRQALEGHPA